MLIATPRLLTIVLVLGELTALGVAARADDGTWLAELPAAAKVVAAFPASTPPEYAKRAAAFAVLTDVIEVRSGIDQNLVGTALLARLSPEARLRWKEYVGGGYSKILTSGNGSWQMFISPAFRADVLGRFLPKASIAAYEDARNRIPNVAGPSNVAASGKRPPASETAQNRIPGNAAPSPPLEAPGNTAAAATIPAPLMDVPPLSPIRFALGSARPKDAEQEDLRELGLWMTRHREIKKMILEGHTNNRGTPASQQALSRARALSVRAALVSLGVEGERLNVVGFGSSKPIANNASAAGRASNERVEIELEAGPVDEYGGHYGSDGFYYDRFGGHYNDRGYESDDGSYKSRCGERYDASSDTAFDAKGAEIRVPKGYEGDKKGFLRDVCLTHEVIVADDAEKAAAKAAKAAAKAAKAAAKAAKTSE